MKKSREMTELREEILRTLATQMEILQRIRTGQNEYANSNITGWIEALRFVLEQMNAIEYGDDVEGDDA